MMPVLPYVQMVYVPDYHDPSLKLVVSDGWSHSFEVERRLVSENGQSLIFFVRNFSSSLPVLCPQRTVEQ